MFEVPHNISGPCIRRWQSHSHPKFISAIIISGMKLSAGVFLLACYAYQTSWNTVMWSKLFVGDLHGGKL